MPATAKTTPAQWVDLLVRHGAALRTAGVTKIEIGECLVELAPPDQVVSITADDEDEDGFNAGLEVDPLDDQNTFGGPIPMRDGRRK
jgi:hypothetical protein